LYLASQAGVKIRLLVRGVCCLRPGVPRVSENITVRSIVGRFLEHSRVYRFENAGKPEIYLASADWTARNFFHRVEVCVPVEDPELVKRVDQIIATYWQDNAKAREQRSEPTYVRKGVKGEQVDAQAFFREQARQRKKPNVNVRSLVIKSKTKNGKSAPRDPQIGQPA
jgi:polyphosphate kinase